TSRGTDVFRLFSTIENKKHSQMLVISGHTTWIHRLNPQAYNAEMRLGTLIFKLLAAVPEQQKSNFLKMDERKERSW
ncbi:3525_t:CDS:1, partial [Dentiscutata erythropus]